MKILLIIFYIFDHCRSVKFTVREFNGKNYELHIARLFDDIVTPESSYKVCGFICRNAHMLVVWFVCQIKKDVVVIMLKKKTASKWGYVTHNEAKIAQEEKRRRDRNKPKMDADADPNASLMGMLKQMYEDGDDEMKRTLAKAWTESQDKRIQGDSS